MPMRTALGAPAWESWLALGLMLALIVALVWAADRIYRNSVLRMGTRIKLGDALRSGA
jgi:ABC-2 type transport system permease protein